MREFIINEQQASLVLGTLGKFPAEQVLNAIDILRNLRIANKDETIDLDIKDIAEDKK